MRKTIKRAGQAALRVAAKLRMPIIIGADRIQGLAHVHGIAVSAELIARGSASRMSLGRGVWIGERTEIEAANIVDIGDDTSLQHGCIVRGDVSIGAHCIFGRSVLVISTSHRFCDTPQWLIRDQDRAFQQLPAVQQAAKAAPIRIEDDCWFGQGSAVMPGVYVGRGAIVGANTVVTRDIAPYEIHGGAPNRKLSERLAFSPPACLDAVSVDALPYFYRGFDISQAGLAASRRQGLVRAGGHACLILSMAREARLTIKGRILDGASGRLQLWINGRDHGVHDVAGDFELESAVVGIADEERVPAPLRQYTYVEINSLSGADICYGLSHAGLAQNSQSP